MDESLNLLVSLINQCTTYLNLISGSDNYSEKSESTKDDYKKLAKNLIDRSTLFGGCLEQTVQQTSRVNTFYKRIAALTYYFQLKTLELAQEGSQTQGELALKELAPKFTHLLAQLKALLNLQKTGLTSKRTKRRSKRQSLSGLPADWRTTICERGNNGKYRLPLLLAALTGARPRELTNGVTISSTCDEEYSDDLIHFKVIGAKVKKGQGQPERTISFSVTDKNPLIQLLLKTIGPEYRPEMIVKIDNSTNFTVEVRRLAKKLWPNHKHSITAYCFRHQFSADIKAISDSDQVSKGLGHISTKTSRSYGTARQSNRGEQLRPLKIEATRRIKHAEIRFGQNHQNFGVTP
jgi:integrase